MRNKLRSSILCLAAVSCFTVNGSIYADDSSFEQTPDAAQERTASLTEKRTEAVEKADFSAADAEKFLRKIGSCDGCTVYLRDKDYDEEIWKSHGFTDGKKPASKNKLTEKQQAEKQAAEDEIDIVKKLGEGVIISSADNEPVAVLKKVGSKKKILTYKSSQGRFLVTLDEDSMKLLKIRFVVSTLDSEQIFLSDGGDTLERMSEDFKSAEKIWTFSRTENGKRIYSSEESSAWLTADCTHFLGSFRCAAENDSYRMLCDDTTAIIGLENKDTGYIWWSAPPEATQDTYATELLVQELRSSNVMKFGIPESRNANNTLRSMTDDCTIRVTDIPNGIKVFYDYEDAGFSFPVEYTLEKDCLKASLDVDNVEEKKSANIATEMTLLGGFGAASEDEDGYFVIPDGCGALVRFNNDRTMVSNAYCQKVYGNDVTAVPKTRGAVAEQLCLPVFGIVKDDNAMLVVASKGDSNANLSVKTSKQSMTSYNICNFSFTLRSTDTYSMSGNSLQELTVFEHGDIRSDDIELRYYPISKKNADYTDVAAKYREYLTDNCGLTPKTKPDSAPLYVDLYGGVLKKKSVLGIPVTMKTSVTSYSQAEDILGKLYENGVDEIVASYKNWTSDGIKNKIDTDASPSWTLGGKKDFNSLTDFLDKKNISFYPVSDNRDFYSGNGYFSFTGTAVRVSGNYSRIVSYDRAYGIPDGFKKNMSLISPQYFSKIFDSLSDSYSDAGLEGVSVANLTTSLYGDYGKKHISRYDAMNRLTECYSRLASSLGDGILAPCANAYALPYVSHITKMPLTSSRFDIFDEDIPFCQLVLHGIIPYSSQAVNGSADSETLLLMAAVTGSNLNFDLLHEEAGELKDTEFDCLYYANYAGWIETAAAEYELLAPVLRDVSDSTIESYAVENSGTLITSVFSNGSVVTADLDKKTIDFNGKIIDLRQIQKERGLRF